jgi:hypothetical protein
MPEFFVQNWWAGLSVWILLFVSDYTLTLVCARLYQKGVREKIVFEGSYELTPYFQRDIDALRRVSPRFVWALVAMSVVLFVFWQVSRLLLVPEMYSFLLGALISTQLALHTRHLRNLFLFRAAATDVVRGRIEYSRRLSLRASAIDMLTLSGLFFVVFVFMQSWFVLGGAFACGSVAAKHWRLANKQVPTVAVRTEKTASVGMS